MTYLDLDTEASLTVADATLHTACICFIGLCQNPSLSYTQILHTFDTMFHPSERTRARHIIRSLCHPQGGTLPWRAPRKYC